jgi:hypothetical protein
MLVLRSIGYRALLAMLLEHQLGQCATVHETPASINYRTEYGQQIRQTSRKPSLNVSDGYIVASMSDTLQPAIATFPKVSAVMLESVNKKSQLPERELAFFETAQKLIP